MVEIRLFRACAVKNTQFNAYLLPNRRNYRVIMEIGVEKRDCVCVCVCVCVYVSVRLRKIEKYAI